MILNHTTTKIYSFVMAAAIFLSSCSSVTMINSVPPGAKLYMNGEVVGTTPYAHRDTKIVGSTTSLKLEKEGYEPFYSVLSRDEEADIGAIIGGVLILIPFLWTMKYKPTHTYELTPLSGNVPIQEIPVVTKSKADQLRELKMLLDEKVITQQEYEKEKQKILDGNN